MPTLTTHRYTLQPYAGPKSRTSCPACGQAREFTRYVDTDTGELLPDEYGRCNRETNCGYSLSPYTRPAGGGHSYAWATERGEQLPGAPLPIRRVSVAPALVPSPVVSIPVDVYRASLGHYERNTFARLLRAHFGVGVADELLNRFHVGTSAYWPGATVFWQVDELGRVRAGKIMLFDETFHRVKKPYPHINSVPKALIAACQRRGQPVPAWLAEYEAHGQTNLFGLSQLATAPATQPVAVVESEKTAILSTPYSPRYCWLATGGLGYLTADRLAPLKGRRIVLFPDAGALDKWQAKADELRGLGFDIAVVKTMETLAAEDASLAGSDLADVLLREYAGYPPDWDAPPL